MCTYNILQHLTTTCAFEGVCVCVYSADFKWLAMPWGPHGSPWVPIPRVELWASNGLGVPFLGECTSGLIVTAMVSKLRIFFAMVSAWGKPM